MEGFEVVGVAPSVAAGSQSFTPARRTSHTSTTSPNPAPNLASHPEPEGQDPERREVVVEIGRFLDRACRGEHRGTSGRDRVSLAFRYYIVLAGYDGVVFEQAQIYSKFAQVKNICKRGPILATRFSSACQLCGD